MTTATQRKPGPTAGRRQPWLDLSIRRKGLVVLLLPLLALVPTIVGTLALQKRQTELRHQRLETRMLTDAADNLLLTVIDAETGARGFLATGNPEFLDPYTRSEALLPVALRRIRADGSPFPAAREEAAQAALAAWSAHAAAAQSRSTDPATIEQLLERGKSRMDRAREAVTDLQVMLMDRLDVAQRDADELEDITNRTAVGGLVLGGLVSLVGVLVFTRSIVQRVERVARDAGRLAQDVPLNHVDPAADELGQLSRELHQAAALLDERAALITHARDRAVAATLAKDQFLSRMSHELRTPLTAVIGFGQLLQMEPLSPDNKESVDHIVRAGRHLLDLINEVLDIARIEAGEMSLSLEPIALGDVVQECAALLGPAADEQMVSVTVGADSPADLAVLADGQRLKQVLLNLLSNAIKYNRVGGTVDVVWAVRDGAVRIEVRDTGLGISEEGKHRVFVPFDRADATNTAVDGTGVGLSLSRSLVEAMDGTLDFTSEQGVGTTFWVDLPTTALPRVAIAVDDRVAAVEAWSDGAAGPDAGTVLYVEDNLANVRVMERLFRTRPEQLEVAMQGSLCIELAERLTPNLILLDLHLPDLSGEDVLRRLKADARTRDIPVVILSADTGARRMDRLLELGASDYLSKPLDLERLLEVLDATRG